MTKKIAKKKTRKPDLAALNQVVKHAMTKTSESAEAMRVEMREHKKKQDEYIREEQERCPHMKGANCLSARLDNGDASIVWHRLHAKGDVIGICTNCTRKFLPTDKDYEFWRAQPTSNIPSAGGGIAPATVRAISECSEYQQDNLNLDEFNDEEVAALLEETAAFLTELAPNFKNMSRPERLHILTSLRSFGSLISETKEYHNVLE